MTSKTSKLIKGTKVGERPTTRASTRTEIPYKCDTDSEKSQIIFTNKQTDTATPSATISAATTRASSVDPPRQLSESLTKVKRRNCQSNKKDGVVHKKTSKTKKSTGKTIELDYSSHPSDDEDDLAKKRAYRAIERRAREKVCEFINIKASVLAYKKKELEEEYLSLIEKTHPAYVENIGRLDEEHQKMQQLLENNRLLEIQQSQNLYESQVSQIRHVALHERRIAREAILHDIEVRKYRLIKEHKDFDKKDPRDLMIDLVVRNDQTQPALTSVENSQRRIFFLNILLFPSETKLSKDEIEDDFVAMQLYTRTKPLSIPSPQPNNITVGSTHISSKYVDSAPHSRPSQPSVSSNNMRNYVSLTGSATKWVNVNRQPTLEHSTNRINGRE
ncbi:3819_t:CDS:2 [Racocetra persica]|uniref:3819_t:CDS:1 n=1 Tax=Racocetra persica TaxID=160502 RepID=A0ACA9L865_9GLOM|nr:3819_t:CDS:2 [Racocetra persica]